MVCCVADLLQDIVPRHHLLLSGFPTLLVKFDADFIYSCLAQEALTWYLALPSS